MSIFFEELKELIEEINVLVFRLGHNDTGKKYLLKTEKNMKKNTQRDFVMSKKTLR